MVVLWSTSWRRRCLPGVLSALQRVQQQCEGFPKEGHGGNSSLFHKEWHNAVFVGGKPQEIANGFRRAQGNFLDSSPLHTERDNKITCSDALMKGSTTCASCLASESPATFTVSRVPSWEAGGKVQETVWSDTWSLSSFQRMKPTEKLNTHDPLILHGQISYKTGLYSQVLSITLLAFLSCVCLKKAFSL